MSLDSMTSMKSRSPLKLSIAFALGIILPSGFLGYLGLRSYQYETQLMQKETEERYAIVADRVEKQVTDRFVDLQTALRMLARQPPVQRLDIAALFPFLLTTHRLETITIDHLYVFDDMDQMVAPWHRDNAPTLRTVRRQDLDWGPYAEDIERLERLEFAQKDFRAALHGYTALQSRALTPLQQASLLKNIAGDYRKLKDYSQSASTYLKLARTFEHLTDFSGFPMGLLGRQMAIELYEGDNSWTSALDVRLDLYEGLLFYRWKVSGAQRSTLLQTLKAAVDHTFSSHPSGTISSERQKRWEHLRDVSRRLESLELDGQRFAGGDWPPLLRRIRQLGRMDSGAILRVGQSDRDQIALTVPILGPDSDRRRGLLVAILSAPPVWSLIEGMSAPLAQPSSLRIDWNTALKESPSGTHRWAAHLEREVRVVDPPLHFSLIDAGNSSKDQIFRRRQWIFGGMIGLSILTLLMGLLFMGQAVKRETEVANLKADFVANVSHELRTPLTAISHIGERLSQGRYRSEEERTELYGFLGKETGRLRRLIEDILDFSKMLAGKKVYRQERLDLVEVAREALEAFESKADARGFQVASDLSSNPVRIVGDPRALQQVVLNLLDNALKYSGESTEIDIKVTQEGQAGIVAVRDHGIGIAESEKDKIFEKFYRVERGATGQTEGGVGLGLAMVKHVIDGHGARIRVDSTPGQGSVFSILFPLAEEVPHGSHSGH